MISQYNLNEYWTTIGHWSFVLNDVFIIRHFKLLQKKAFANSSLIENNLYLRIYHASFSVCKINSLYIGFVENSIIVFFK